MAEEVVKILFLCTGNSCRSQMAEGWANHLGEGRVRAASAGVRPTAVQPLAVAVMREVGVDISAQRSKDVSVFLGEEFDFVITLCDNAREECPFFPGAKARLHWPVDDPYGLDISAYRRARDEIKGRVEQFLREHVAARGEAARKRV